MTLYGWDASHYDGLLSTAVLARARAEGISFFTHKIAEGTSNTERRPGGGDYDDTALAAARDAGIEFLGGYHVVRSAPSVAVQVDALVAFADAGEPWWRGFPGWFWQVDLEHWPGDPVSAATGIAFGQLLRQRTGKTVVMYASKGQYGDQLTGWGGPLWNANYPSSRQAGFVSLYPGDNGIGWARYSGQAPVFWQYASSATIAGLTTCDANAFRGGVQQLRALIESGADMYEQYDRDLLANVYEAMFGKKDKDGNLVDPSRPGLVAELVAVKAKLDAGTPVVLGGELASAVIAAIQQHTTVDLDALSTAVADKLAARLQS